VGGSDGKGIGFWREREVSAPRCQKRVKSIRKRPSWARRNIGQTRGCASMCIEMRAVRMTAANPISVRKRKMGQASAK
jgi:hypothetical protein